MRTGFKPYATKQGDTKSENYGKQTDNYTVSDGTRYPLSIIEFKRDKQKIHPTQKPVALMEYLIKTYTNENETVLDFTMGSGTTGVACVNTGRNFIGIELDPDYFAIAEKRINEQRPKF
jgi:site-specific DNA-methyltransferase (adenine-specific)